MDSIEKLSMSKLKLQMDSPSKLEITKYKHQITRKFQIYNIQIRRWRASRLFGILNFGHC